MKLNRTWLHEDFVDLSHVSDKEYVEKLKTKMTIILTTHYLEEAEALSDRIAIMTRGKLRAVGTAEELKKLAGKGDFEEAFIEIAERAERNELK